MKKTVVLLLATMLAMGIVACGESESTVEYSNQNTESTYDDSVAPPDIDFNLVQKEMSNFVNDGMYCVYDGWIYTISFSEDDGAGLLAKLRTDGTEYTVLAEKGTPHYINVDGEYIYATLRTSSSNHIYRCRLGGNDLIQLIEADAEYLQVYNDQLYYNKCNLEDGQTTGFYKCNKDGTNEELVLEKEIYYSYIVNDILYYQDDADGETIYSYNLNTKETEKITTGYSYEFVVDGEYGYYIQNEKSVLENDFVGNVTKINLKTKEETTLYEGASTGEILVRDDSVFFLNANDNYRIYSIGKDGSGIKLISQDINCSNLATYGDCLLYMKYDEDYNYVEGVYVCNLDGSDKIEISSLD